MVIAHGNGNGNGNCTMVMQRFPVGANKWSELSKKVMSSELDNNFRKRAFFLLNIKRATNSLKFQNIS